MKLYQRNAIITGANQGFGFAVAEAFMLEGASIAICARDEEKLTNAKKKLLALSQPHQIVFAQSVDVSIESEVETFIHKSIETLGSIDVIVNNAGIYGPKGSIEIVDSNAWTKAIAINLFGVFYVCKHILPHMKQQHSGKIINLSGGGATNPLPHISAYAASKAAVVRLTETLAEECREYGIDVNAVAPGALNTRLLEEILEAGPALVGQSFYTKATKQKESGGASLKNGAELCVYLASDESNGITGKLISAVWDPWQRFADYKEELNSDIYTLRRIVPEDRGKKWESL